MEHTVLITVHAVFATAAFAAGLLVMVAAVRRDDRRPWPVRAHTVGISVMSAALPPSLVVGWSGFAGPAGPIFVGLTVLAGYMVWTSLRADRAWRASQVLQVVDDVGFNLVGLGTGFLAVAVLRAGGSVVGIVLVAVVTPLIGHWVIHRLRARVARTDLAPATEG